MRAHLPFTSNLDIVDLAAAGLDDPSDTTLLASAADVLPSMQFRSFGLVLVETRAQDQGICTPFVDACGASLGTEEANTTSGRVVAAVRSSRQERSRAVGDRREGTSEFVGPW